MSNEDWETAGDAIRARRRVKKLSQEEAAEQAGVGVQTWRNLEAARGGDHRDDTLDAVEHVLEWPIGTIRRLVAASDTVRTASPWPLECEVRISALEEEVAKLRRNLNRSIDLLQAATGAMAVDETDETSG